MEHDCRVGACTHISPRAVLCGTVLVGEESHIGAGAVVRNNLRVCSHTVVGAGSVVVGISPSPGPMWVFPCGGCHEQAGMDLEPLCRVYV